MKKASLIIMIITLSIAPAFGQQMGAVEYSIRFYDKAIYFPDSRIYVHAEIVNNTPDTFRFKVSPERVFNLDFEVKTLANEMLEHSQEFIIDRNTDQPLLYRELSLEPGERYSVVEDLTRFISISTPGVYMIRGLYHPELSVNAESKVLVSNFLTLSVLPGKSEIGPTVIIDRETGQPLQQESLPPDEIISYLLSARQKGDWDKFFLYIDVEGLYKQDRGREESYLRQMSDQERRATLMEYRDSLTRETTSDEFILIPSSFTIRKTSYTPTDATVLVEERFDYTDFTEVKLYTYYLRRRDRIWTLYNYEVQNLRTE